MSRFREQDRKARRQTSVSPPRSIFLIEDSLALGLLLKGRIEAETATTVQWFKTQAEAADALSRQRPSLAVSGLNLPDAPDGEIVDLLESWDVPTILFTATLNRKVRERFASANIIDYFVKDAPDTVDQIVRTIVRLAENSAIAVLVVDDMESSRSSLVELLRQQNFRTFEACSGAQALELLDAHDDIELVITDYFMPDMDGHELTRHIRARHAPDRLRVIGISASSDPFLSASFLKAGASDFVYRPYIVEEVKCRIESNIETLNQIKRLRFLAERDPLTGLYNRRAFFERADGELERLRLNDGQGSVAILDIDHFKKVNDTYGHDTGDRVIKAVAGVLNAMVDRGNAITARFGGEEFLILFTDIDSDEVQARCEQMRQMMADLAIPYEDTALSVTVSIGVALIQHQEGMDNNLNAADQMLYMAKNSGRNRVLSDALFCRT